ncbi:MAG: amidohydrolase family protein [Myxococcales bacterium]|nr:amidohydrolase family protein [Myxococcales bacterium]
MSRPAANPGAYLLRGGVLLPVVGEAPFGAGDILVQNGCIAALGDALQAPPDATVIDCREGIILPGLVQAHIHLCQTLCRGRADDLRLLDWLRLRVLPYEAALSEADITLAAQLACAELLLSGTTAILDMGTVRHQDALCQAVAASGLRATVGKAMMDHGDDVPAPLRETTGESLAESDALCQRWHGAADGRLHYAYAPRFVLSCSDALLRGVAERLASAGPATGGIRPRLHTHASEQLDEVAVVRARYGQGNVDALAALGLSGPQAVLAHCVHLDEGEIARIAQQGTHVAHCPSSNLKLGSGIAKVVELLDAGINVALGADGAPCSNRLDGLGELRLAALLQKGRLGPTALPAARALAMATLGGAKALGLQDRIGSLHVGKRADLLVVSRRGVGLLPEHAADSQVVYAASAQDVRHVLVDGRWLVADGQLRPETGLDVERLRALAHERMPTLLRRAGLA